MWLASTLLVAAAAGAGAPAPEYVDDCRPCRFNPGPGTGEYAFSFDIKSDAGGRAVRTIRVEHGPGQPAQVLEVPGMMAVAPGDPFFFGGIDVDFDGFLDLMLLTEKGTANAYARYWRFDPASGTYTPLGRYPVFAVDRKNRRLSTYERGGAAGAVYEKNQYEFKDGKPLLLRSEKQEATSRPDIFRRVVRVRQGGAMKTVETKMVRTPAASPR